VARIVSLLELTLPTGTLYLSDLEDDRIPGFIAKLSGPLKLARSLPDPFYGLQAADAATVALSNIDVAGDAESTTLSEILSTTDLVGAAAVVRIRDLEAGADLIVLYGVVAAVTSLTQTEAALEIASGDGAALQRMLPAVATLDWFPSAAVPAVEHAVIVPFGTMRKAELALLHAHYLELSFSMVATGGGGNNYLYEDLTATPDYVVGAGDVLYYDVLWLDSQAQIGLELQATDGTSLRGAGTVDQNGYPAAGDVANVVPDSLALNRWYRRSVKLDALVGKTVSRYGIFCEQNSTGTFRGRIANAAIISAIGAVRVAIFNETTADPVGYASLLDGNTGANVFTPTRASVYDYGPIRKPASGALTVSAVYRDGRLVDASEYVIQEPIPGVNVLRFTRAQRTGQGSAYRIQADLRSSEFARPSDALKLLLSDATYGLGLAVDAASFTQAAADYAAIGYGVAGGLNAQTRAIDLLGQLLLRGAVLDRNATGAYTLAVDKLALHAEASFSLGQGDAYGWQNCEVTADARSRAEERTQRLILSALPDPGFSGSAAFLASSQKSRTGAGVTKAINLSFLDSPAALDVECDYLWKRLLALERKIVVDGADEVRALRPNDLVKLYAPNLHIAGDLLEVRGISLESLKAEIGLVPWNATAFTYEATGSLRVDPKAAQVTDYSRTYPVAPTNLRADSPVTIINANGKAESKIRVHADAPAANVTRLVFQAVKLDLAAARSRIDVACTPGQVGVVADLTVDPGLVYDVQVFARNDLNDSGFQDGFIATLPNVVVSADTNAPTNAPAPSSISTVLNADGSMDVTLQWTYAQGVIPADLFMLVWKSGTAPLGAPAITDKGVLLTPNANVYTFHGLDPAVNYRFGIAAARKPNGALGYIAGAVQSPTASPDWADIAAVGNYTGNVGGTAASTVVANAANGQTAYSGTTLYRSAGAPTNAPVPSAIASAVENDGSVSYKLNWNYTQGALQADGFFLFWKQGSTNPGSPTTADQHIDVGWPFGGAGGAQALAARIVGFSQDSHVTFGVAAYRRTNNGIEIGAIVLATSSPDWDDVTTGSPIYNGLLAVQAWTDTFDVQHDEDWIQPGGSRPATVTYNAGYLSLGDGWLSCFLRRDYVMQDGAIEWDSDFVQPYGGAVIRYMDALNFYLVIMADDTGVASEGSTILNAQIWKCYRGAFTAIGATVDFTFTRNTLYHFKFEAIGSTLNLYQDGVLKRTVTDTSIPGPGFVGFWSEALAKGYRAHYQTALASGVNVGAWNALAATPAVDVGGIGGTSTALGVLLNSSLATLGANMSIPKWNGSNWTNVLQFDIAVPASITTAAVIVLANMAATMSLASGSGTSDVYWQLVRQDLTSGTYTTIRTSGNTNSTQGSTVDIPALFAVDKTPVAGSTNRYFLQVTHVDNSGSVWNMTIKTPASFYGQLWSN
jgi:hypothetical protein